LESRIGTLKVSAADLREIDPVRLRLQIEDWGLSDATEAIYAFAYARKHLDILRMTPLTMLAPFS
jgi:hypothetical protein